METQTEKIIQKLKSSGYSPRVIEHDPVITIGDVVRTLDISTDLMAKTLLLSQKDIGLIATILPGMNRVDFSKVAAILGVSEKTVKFAGPEITKKLGLNSGDMCPFHEFFQNIIVDAVLLRQRTVYCGSSDPRKTIVIDPEEMVKAIGAIIADISQTTSNTQTKGDSNE
jgi:prolyl-tRNA editing enzyme YbaK/EbsC (Cys-tRNA(Pro) deacylase)